MRQPATNPTTTQRRDPRSNALGTAVRSAADHAGTALGQMMSIADRPWAELDRAHVLGLQAFGLDENKLYPQADDAGRPAVTAGGCVPQGLVQAALPLCRRQMAKPATPPTRFWAERLRLPLQCAAPWVLARVRPWRKHGWAGQASTQVRADRLVHEALPRLADALRRGTASASPGLSARSLERLLLGEIRRGRDLVQERSSARGR